MAEKISGFTAARLLHLWSIDKTEPPGGLDYIAARGRDAGQKPVSIEHSDDWHTNSVGPRLFWR
jgi:hypothetical protein